jgi:hypothetical protein
VGFVKSGKPTRSPLFFAIHPDMKYALFKGFRNAPSILHIRAGMPVGWVERSETHAAYTRVNKTVPGSLQSSSAFIGIAIGNGIEKRSAILIL